MQPIYQVFDKQLYPLITVEELEIEEIELNSLNALENTVYAPLPKGWNLDQMERDLQEYYSKQRKETLRKEEEYNKQFLIEEPIEELDFDNQYIPQPDDTEEEF